MQMEVVTFLPVTSIHSEHPQPPASLVGRISSKCWIQTNFMIKLLVTEIAFVDLAALRLLVVKDERSDVAREEAGGCAGKMPR